MNKEQKKINNKKYRERYKQINLEKIKNDQLSKEDRKCKRCKQILSFDKFGIMLATPSGYNYKCKVCVNEIGNTHEEKKRKAIYRKEKTAKIKAENLEKRLNNEIDTSDIYCSGCDNILSYDMFHLNITRVSGKGSLCKICKHEEVVKNYAENKEEINNKNRKRRSDAVKWLHEIKNVPCKDCGETFHPYCMDFDHLDPATKVKNVSRMILENAPKDRILKEIDKCDIICILCHNERTYDRQQKKNKEYRIKNPIQTNGSKRYYRDVEIINKAKNKPCAICNSLYIHYNMQLDHIDPSTKAEDVCQLKGRSPKKLQAEIEKCQVICALCHRIKSVFEQKFQINLENSHIVKILEIKDSDLIEEFILNIKSKLNYT
jgi:hypothetical protein